MTGPNSGLPFANNSFDVAALIACQNAAHRQKFIAAIASAAITTSMHLNDALIFTLREETDDSVVSEKTAVLMRDDVDRIVSMSEGDSKNDRIRPWAIAEFVIAACVRRGSRTQRAKALAESLLDDLEEKFQSDCRKFGARSARIRYLARVVVECWPFVQRAIPRLLRWAAIISVAKRLLSGW
jgi:hypothetical protein